MEFASGQFIMLLQVLRIKKSPSDWRGFCVTNKSINHISKVRTAQSLLSNFQHNAELLHNLLFLARTPIFYIAGDVTVAGDYNVADKVILSVLDSYTKLICKSEICRGGYRPGKLHIYLCHDTLFRSDCYAFG